MRIAPDYYCTWLTQGQLWARRNHPYEPVIEAWTRGAPDVIDEEAVFGPEGWARMLPEGMRKELYFLFDCGWDVPYGTLNTETLAFGSLLPDPERFPSTRRLEGAEKLAWLDRELRRLGWRGLGLWVAAHEAGGLLDGPRQRAYWEDRVRISRAAGVEYWKVDWGERMLEAEFRALLTALGRRLHPALWIEHGLFPAGQTNDGRGGGTFNQPERLAFAREQLRFADIFRTYDCTWCVNRSVTQARAAELIEAVRGETLEGEAVLNLESAPFLAMGLGGTFGAMTVAGSYCLPEALWRRDDSMRPELADAGEALRAAAFRPFAPPLGLHRTENRVSEAWLTDEYEVPEVYGPDAGWNRIRVPAAVTRDLPLPSIADLGDGVPLFSATRYPGKTLAVAALPRAVAGAIRLPLADIVLEVPEIPDTVGVFGKFAHLELRFGGEGGAAYRVADLAGGPAASLEAGDGCIRLTRREVREASQDGVKIPGVILTRIS